MLKVEKLSKYYNKKILDNITFCFKENHIYCISGKSGSGKSTFLKILSKELEPNSGEVIIDKNERMSKLEQNQNKYDDKTVLETVLLGHKRLVEIEKKNLSKEGIFIACMDKSL